MTEVMQAVIKMWCNGNEIKERFAERWIKQQGIFHVSRVMFSKLRINGYTFGIEGRRKLREIIAATKS